MKNIRHIIFAPDDKITSDTHDLIERIFNIEGAWLSNESTLEDFIESDKNVSIEKMREKLIERIAELYGVVVPEMLSGETRIWKVALLIKEKLRSTLLSKPTNPRIPS